MKYSTRQHPLGYVHLDPLPSEAELEQHYRHEYFQRGGGHVAEFTDAEREWNRNHSRVIERVWQQQCGDVTGRFLDVGCGYGFVSAYLLRQGWRVDALDFSSFGVATHNPELLPFFTQGNIYELLQARIDSGATYDLVSLSNVLEHVRDPLELLDRLKALGDDRTLFQIMVPNDCSPLQRELLSRGLMGDDLWFFPPDHINYFNFASLRRVLENRGFHVVTMLANFPIEALLFNEHANYWKNPAHGKQAHRTRVDVENFLVAQGLDAYTNYMAAAAGCGFGRSATAFVRKS